MTNSWPLMAFQSDILSKPVIRPVIAETTALGAAYAAGLTVGVWKNVDSYAFQQACNTASSLGGAKLYIPPTKEYYRILFPVYIGDNTELFGEGQTTRIVFENPIFNKGRGGFVIGSSLEANRHLAFKRYSNFTHAF